MMPKKAEPTFEGVTVQTQRVTLSMSTLGRSETKVDRFACMDAPWIKWTCSAQYEAKTSHRRLTAVPITTPSSFEDLIRKKYRETSALVNLGKWRTTIVVWGGMYSPCFKRGWCTQNRRKPRHQRATMVAIKLPLNWKEGIQCSHEVNQHWLRVSWWGEIVWHCHY